MPARKGATKARGAEQSAPSASVDLAAIVAQAVGPLMEQVNALRDEVRSVKTSQPRFQPMELPNARGATAGMKKGEQRMGDQSIDHGPDSHPLPSYIKFQYPPRFQVGDTVRINPDVTRHGAEKSWGVLLEEFNSDGYGTISKKVHFDTNQGSWKYVCKFPGITGPQGDGYYDEELIPA